MIATVGAGVVGAGICTVSAVLIGGGLAVLAVSVLVTWVLHLAGWGKPPGLRPRSQWPMGVRDPQARQGHAGCVGCRLAGRGRSAVTESAPVPVGGEPEPAAATESVG